MGLFFGFCGGMYFWLWEGAHDTRAWWHCGRGRCGLMYDRNFIVALKVVALKPLAGSVM